MVTFLMYVGGSGRRLQGGRVKCKTGQGLHARDDPDQGLVRKTAVRIAAADIAVNPGKPGLLDVSFRGLPFGRGPERRHKWAAMFIDANGMKADVDMIAKFGIVEAKHFQRDVSRQRRKADTGRNSV